MEDLNETSIRAALEKMREIAFKGPTKLIIQGDVVLMVGDGDYDRGVEIIRQLEKEARDGARKPE
jgi:hypothetical protein